MYLECDDAAAVPHPHPMAEGQAQGPAQVEHGAIGRVQVPEDEGAALEGHRGVLRRHRTVVQHLKAASSLSRSCRLPHGLGANRAGRTMSQFLDRPMRICFFSRKLSWNCVLNRSSAVSCLHHHQRHPHHA